MAKGYWVVFADVSDPEGYKAYIAENAKPFKKYGGRFLVRGGPHEAPQGKPPSRVLVVGVPTYRPALEPGAQCAHRRRQDENADDVAAEPLAHLTGALPVDVEQHVAPLRQHLFDRLARRAIEVAVNLRPFEQIAAFLHPVEFALVDEAVMNAVDLGRAPRAGGHRHRERQIERLVLPQHAGQRRLAGARRRTQHHAP